MTSEKAEGSRWAPALIGRRRRLHAFRLLSPVAGDVDDAGTLYVALHHAAGTRPMNG